MKQGGVQTNLILSSLSRTDYERLQPHLGTVPLRLRQCLEAANRPVQSVVFPHRGIVSVVAISNNRQQEAEVGLIGWEGMTGLSVVLGTDMSPMNTFVQVEGEAQSIDAPKLRILMAESSTLCEALYKYVHAFAVQAAHTGLATARSTLDQRLARWLLMAQDRVEDDELHLTHEFLGLMLGVRRAGVTVALHALEAEGLIEMRRSSVRITNRAGLVTASAGFYGTPEQYLKRLFPRVAA
jgi:CRP-like cAMP-binding protein